jgi:hypothetical protein
MRPLCVDHQTSDMPSKREYGMDTALISTLSALAGSIVGGVTSGATTWISHQYQAKAGHRLHNLAQRENLYRDFVVAASETYGGSMVNNEPEIHEVIGLYGMISRMRILSDPLVVECAEQTVNSIIDTYFSPKKSLLELRALMERGEAIDPLRRFSEVSRSELSAL